MILEVILLALAGIGIGTFAMLPGIHVNTTIPLILSISLIFNLQPYYIAVLIVSVAIAEGFADFIPSIFIGAPDADTALSVLPGHRLLLEGRGYEAIKLSIIGSVGSLIFTLILISLFPSFFSFLYEVSRPYVAYLLVFVVLFMILSEKKIKKILSSVLIILLSGFLGVISLNSSIIPQGQVLFPVLTGLFGLSVLITSISERSSIPEQEEDSDLKISKKDMIRSMILASIGGIIAGFLPAVGISEIATMIQYLGGSGEARSFLMAVSGINTSNDVFSLISLYLMGNPRSGASVAIQQILTELSFYDVLFFIGVICFVAGISAILTLFLGKRIPRYLTRLNYRNVCLSVIIFISVMIFLLTGPFGLLIAFTSTAIGILCQSLEIRRSHCMGVLLIPSILFFAGLSPTVIGILGI